jgi:hypothetical protein
MSIGKITSQEEFNRFLNKKVEEDVIDLFYRKNLVNPIKVELFREFTLSLLETIHDTYPGDDVDQENYYLNHFTFAFKKIVSNFKEEHLYFNGDEKEVFDYFYLTLEETYYSDKNKSTIIIYLKDLYEKIFDMENFNKTQSDLEIFLDLYKFFIIFFVNKQPK